MSRDFHVQDDIIYDAEFSFLQKWLLMSTS